MNLNQYLEKRGWGSIAELAKACNVTPARISQLKAGDTCPPELALRIEEATGRAVNAASLSPVVARVRAAA